MGQGQGGSMGSASQVGHSSTPSGDGSTSEGRGGRCVCSAGWAGGYVGGRVDKGVSEWELGPSFFVQTRLYKLTSRVVKVLALPC
eukprot:170379-Pelagomonas_calceolata.AAC.8